MSRNLSAIAGLAALLFAIDRLYRVFHPEVDLVRATLVGLTAFAALAPIAFIRRRPLEPWVGALAIFVSASVSVLMIEAGILESRSMISGAVHVAILVGAFMVIDRAARASRPLPSRDARC